MQFECVTDGDRLFARAADVEGGLALALRHDHSIVVRPRHDHRPQPVVKGGHVDLGIPGANSCSVVVEHTNQRVRKVAHVGWVSVGVGALALPAAGTSR